MPDLLAVASFYKDWAKWGGGLKNYLSYGEYPTQGYNKPEAFKYPRGAILNRDLSQVHPVNPQGLAGDQGVHCASRGTRYEGGDQVSLHPWEGETKIKYTGPQAAVRDAGRIREVLVPEDAAVERQSDGSGPAGAAAGCLRLRYTPR